MVGAWLLVEKRDYNVTLYVYTSTYQLLESIPYKIVVDILNKAFTLGYVAIQIYTRPNQEQLLNEERKWAWRHMVQAVANTRGGRTSFKHSPFSDIPGQIAFRFC